MSYVTKIQKDIDGLIEELGNPDGLKRQKARMLLAESGETAIPKLMESLSNSDWRVRWEATKALAVIKDPKSAPELVKLLEDERVDVRWAAMEALIEVGRPSLIPLFQELLDKFDSPTLREGAHHILHVLKDKGELRKEELEVFQSLEGPGSGVKVAWTSKSALDAIEKANEEKSL
jgi:HEAT repeat protein